MLTKATFKAKALFEAYQNEQSPLTVLLYHFRCPRGPNLSVMPFFSAPKAFRLTNAPLSSLSNHHAFASASIPPPGLLGVQSPFRAFRNEGLPSHSSHPPFGHLTLLVFEAVMEVVCVSFPGFIVARQGMFNAEMQKFAANLNVMLFTPCLSTYN